MRATFMYGAGDVRVEDAPDPVLRQPTDAVVRVVRSCVCGSDLHPYHSMPASAQGTPMGHEFLGVVEDLGSEVTGLRRGGDACHVRRNSPTRQVVGRFLVSRSRRSGPSRSSTSSGK